ncbi:MAG: hypothetical protein AAB393_02170, partial [Bacteroidota bacterium]
MRPERTKSNKKVTFDEAMVATVENDEEAIALIAHGNPRENGTAKIEFLADSGANRHIVQSKKLLHNFAAEMTTVRGTRDVVAIGRGDVKILLKDGSTLWLRDTLWHPDIPRNLLSLEKVLAGGGAVHTDVHTKTATVTTPRGHELLFNIGDPVHFLTAEFVVQLNTTEIEVENTACLTAVEADQRSTGDEDLDELAVTYIGQSECSLVCGNGDTKMGSGTNGTGPQNEAIGGKEASTDANDDTVADRVHRRMGHLRDAKGLAMMRDKLMSLPGKAGLTVNYECTDCLAGKLKNEAAPKTNDEREHERVYVDILHGKAAFAAGTNSRTSTAAYLLTALYEDSNYVYLEPLGDLTCLEQSLTRMLTNAVTFKVLRADNEFNTTAIRNWLAFAGIVAEWSVAESSRQAGKIGRFQQTILEGVRTLLSWSKLTDDYWIFAAMSFAHSWNRMPNP